MFKNCAPRVSMTCLPRKKGFGKIVQAKNVANLDFAKNETGLIRLNRATARAAVI
jgi:hypothetical protein